MAYCAKCKKHIGRNYTVKAEPVTLIRGKNVSNFDHMEAYCNICHCKVYNKEAEDMNVLTYRQIFGEVSING